MAIEGIAERVGFFARHVKRRGGDEQHPLTQDLHVDRIGSRPGRVAGRAARAENADRARVEPAAEAESLLQPAFRRLWRGLDSAAACCQQLQRGVARTRSEQAGDDELAMH
jgi:hypothetical protein